MGNNYDKYKLNRRVRGKINLPDPIHETVVHLIAEGNTFDDIILIMGRQTPPVLLDHPTIQAILDDPLAQRRLEYKKRVMVTHKKIPKTASEIMDFAVSGLVRLSKQTKKIAEKTKVYSALGKLATDMQKDAPQQSPSVAPPDSAALDILVGKKNG